VLELSVTLTHDKTTLHKERYSLLDNQDNPGLSSVYIEKVAIRGTRPERVVVAVKAVE
jgi:hypothetical protein